ncbi:MAG: hypothetical protein V4441_01765 [Pseudomonadota bacterium]
MRPADLARFTSLPPRPTFHVEQALSELGFAAQFIVWAMRIQWAHIGDGRQTSLVIDRASHGVDMPEGAALVAELTEALIAATSRPLSIPCPKWRVITGDEARLLGFLAAMQARDGTPLAVCNAEWRSPRHASSIWSPAQRLALAMTSAGLYLTTPATGLTPPIDAPAMFH